MFKKNLPNYFPKCSYHFMSPAAGCESSGSCTSSPTRGMVSPLNASHLNRRIVKCLSAFNLHFPDS